MKKMKKLLAVVIAMAMVLSLGITAFAADTEDSDPHTITITNADQHVTHSYEAYKVLSGSLDEKEKILTNITWGNGVDGEGLLDDLKALTKSEEPALFGDDPLTEVIETEANMFASCETAADFAKVIGTFTSTSGENESAGAIDAVATVIADNLTTNAVIFVQDEDDHTKYTAAVTGDGYYFIKDTTTTLNNEEDHTSDTLSKYLLSVVKDTTIVAKDTGFTPDKKILGAAETKLAADSAAIGDTVTFEVTIPVPNTSKYEDHFWFIMNDQLPTGITFTGISSVKIDSKELADYGKKDPAPEFDDDYDGSDGYYTLAVNGDPADYAWDEDDYDAVAEAGGQAIELTFNEFKKFVEKNSLIGKTITITYTGVVNDDAEYKATANENEVEFKYSSDPNHDYNGDNGTGPTGTTPKSKTRSYTTSLKLLKVDENNEPLAGATFELKGDALNRTVLTGDKFELTTYVAKQGENIDTSTKYWELKDGSFTDTDPTTVTNTTQYVDTTVEYYKVSFNFSEVSEKTTDIVLVSNADGVVEFVGLNEGEYTLEEIAAPSGYNKIDGQATINITWNDPEAEDATDEEKASGGFTFDVEEEDSFAKDIAWNATDKQFEVTIENQSGTELPSTGGIGTTIFYVLGSILVIGAGVVLITRRRMSN